MWDKLNFAQQFSLASLGQFGYTLKHVRSETTGVLAILKLGNKTATINHFGTINTTPEIALRH